MRSNTLTRVSNNPGAVQLFLYNFRHTTLETSSMLNSAYPSTDRLLHH